MPSTTDSPVSFEAFDLAAIRAAKKNGNTKHIEAQTFYTKTNYLSDYYNRVSTLNSALNDLDFHLPEAAQGISVNLTIKIKHLGEALKALADASDDDREDVLEYLADILSNATDTTQRHTKTLKSKLQSLSTPINASTLLLKLEACEADAARVPEEIEKLQEKKSILDGEYATLTSAIDALAGTALPEADKETILDPTKLAALGLTAPQLAAAQAALELLQKVMQELNAALNYLGLISLRDSLRGRIYKVREDIAAKNLELDRIQDRIRLIESIQAFEDERASYTREISTIVSSLESFVAEASDVSSDESGELFVQNANAMIDYLKPIK